MADDSIWMAVALSTSGLVVMLGPPDFHQEIELLSCDHVSVMFPNSGSAFRKGTVILTTQRILFRSEALPTPRAIRLAEISDVAVASSLFSSPKIALRARNLEMQLVFHKQGRDRFHEVLVGSVKAQEWLPLAATKSEKKAFSTHSAGIGGILRTVAHEQISADKSISQAFSDLESLMSYAKEMVEIAEKFTRRTSTTDDDESEFSNILHQMGIPNPVTKENAGSQYHTHLARQLADFLSGVLRQSGGVMMLIDIYCLFNRARGTEVISPDDLLAACKLLSDLNLGLSLRKFESGVLAVQTSEHDDITMAEKILDLIQKHGPVSELEVSRLLKISMHLAKEYLLTAERNEFLCRDSVLEATKFYKNIFNFT